MVVEIEADRLNPYKLKEVVECLKKGGVIIYPTDTVYAMGCDLHNNKAIDKLCRIKGIKADKSEFSFVCTDLKQVAHYAKPLDNNVFKLMKKALPGPYTFILPGSNNLPNPFKKKKTVGIRVPNNNIAIEIVKRLGNPIISTSIRDEDEVLEYTTDPELILEKWDNLVDLVIDGGYGDNTPSTVIDLSEDEPLIVREGKGSLEIF